MFHMHGWIEILQTTDGDEDRSKLNDVVSWVSASAEHLGLSENLVTTGVGGSFLLSVQLVQNRERGDFDRVVELLKTLGTSAPGSYGVVHVRDTDVEDGFRLVVMRRGQVELQADTLLSPAVPTIEDA